MQSIFEAGTRAELIARINALQENAQPQWGRMTVAQMVRHCARCENYYLGNIPVKRSLLGRLVGRLAIKAILKNEESGFRPNSPTPEAFKVTEQITDLPAEKEKWISLLEQYKAFKEDVFVHWFFGKMTREQLGQFIYKHCDHHLKQFGV